MRKDRVTVTNPLLRLLGILLVSQLSVHISENREGKKIRFGQFQPGFNPDVTTLTAPAVWGDFPSLSGCCETHASLFWREANRRRSCCQWKWDVYPVLLMDPAAVVPLGNHAGLSFQNLQSAFQVTLSETMTPKWRLHAWQEARSSRCDAWLNLAQT